MEEKGNSIETPPWKREVPREIMVDIFSRLPLSSVLRLRCLSKQWQSTLKEDYFWDLHAERSPESTLLFTVEFAGNERTQGKPAMSMSCIAAASKTPPAHSNIRLKGPCNCMYMRPSICSYMPPCSTCNGLMCTADLDGGLILVCNPLAAEYIALPRCTIDCVISVGWGYSPISKQYKVVNLGNSTVSVSMGEMRVHTLGADAGWRNVHADVDFQPQWRTSGGGLCVDGKMYWAISAPPPHHGCSLLSFDVVETEEVTKTDIDIPSIRYSFDGGGYRLVPLGGRQVSMVIRECSYFIEEWVMLGDCTWHPRRRFNLHQRCRRYGHLGRMLAVSRTSGDGDMLILFEKMAVRIHNGRINACIGHGAYNSSYAAARAQYELSDLSVCGGYKPSLFSLGSFGGGYEVQQGGRYVAWVKNLLPQF